MDEIKDDLRDDFIAEHKQSLIQADEIGALNRKLAEETRSRLEGFIASEQRVNKMIDGMRERKHEVGAATRNPIPLLKPPT